MLTTLLLLVACDEKPKASSPVAPTIEAPAPKTEAKGFDAKAAPCCDTPEAQGVVDAYLQVQRALASDNEKLALDAARALADRVDPMLLTAGPDAPTLKAVAEGSRLMAGQPLKDARESFKAVSTAMVTFAAAHKGGATAVATTFCPMADASWLQTEKTISNPYYGSEMLTCGYFK